jgi:hypothetical protein
MFVILTLLVALGLGLVGCAQKDAHALYTERMSRLTWEADARSMVDDFHSAWLMDDRPSHLSQYAQE